MTEKRTGELEDEMEKLPRVQHRGSEVGDITAKLRSTEDKMKRPHLYLTEFQKQRMDRSSV